MSSWSGSLYEHAPIPLQNLMVSVQGWRLHRQRYTKYTFQYLAQLQGNERQGMEAAQRWQEESLRAFVQYCYENTEYYRTVMDETGVAPSHIRSASDLFRIPVTPKEALRAEPEQFMASCGTGKRLIEVHTSGTTGSPLTVYFTPRDWQRRHAFLDRCRRWAGVRIGMKRVTFTGRPIIPRKQTSPPFWRYVPAARQMACSPYHLTPDWLQSYVDAWTTYQPEIIAGYPSAIHVVADHISRTDQVGRIRPTAIHATAETVLPHQRKAIEEAFGCKLFNQYASTDGAPFASECRAGKIHAHPESGVFEVLRPDDSLADPGELGRLVVTSFTTTAMPLLRYDIGDTAVASTDHCDCGLPFPTLDAIVGRVDDFVYTPDRGLVGRLDPVFKTLPNSVVQAQIVQTAPHRVVLRLVPDPANYEAHHAALVVEEMRRRLGEVVSIEVEIVRSISRGPGGKMRAVINECVDQLPKGFRYLEAASVD